MKRILTKDERAFLSSQGLSEADVYDGRHLSSGETRKSQAKAALKLIVLRDPTRSRCGHRLTTRAGHCIQCDTSKLAYAARHEAPAFVYIAGSRALKGIKVGVTLDIAQRLVNLNGQAYAEVRDWEMLFYVRFQRAGAVETTAQAGLLAHAIVRTTFKDGRDQETKEVFACSFADAYQAVAQAAQQLNLKPQTQAWKSREASTF